MATDKPRVSVTFEPKTYELLRELAQLQGESMSRIVGGVLDASMPVLVNLLKAARRYEHLSASAKAEMMSRWESAEGKLLPHVREVESTFGELIAEDPRPVTRGSRPPASHPENKIRAVR